MAEIEDVATRTVGLPRRPASHALLVEGLQANDPPGLGRVIAIGALWFVIFVVIAVPITVARIERTLIAETEADLASLGVPAEQVNVEFDFRDGRISGDLPYHVSPEMVANQVDHPLLGRLDVVAASEVRAGGEPAEVGPLELNASFNGERVTVVGEVLSDDQYEAVMRSVALAAPGAELDDRLVVTNVEPAVDGADERLADLVTSLESLGLASQWLVQQTDNSLRIDAAVRNQAIADRLQPVLQQLSAVPTTVEVTVSNRFEGPSTRNPATEAQVDALQVELDELEAEIFETIQFAANSFELTDEAEATLDKVTAVLLANPNPVVDITGHTDTSGDSTTNRALSQRRANAVRAYLASNGVDVQRLRSRGLGSSRPADTNQTEEGRANNRRIELQALRTFD
jgi:outer membrane protein OmpA-like peptidoglycan-associated protein